MYHTRSKILSVKVPRLKIGAVFLVKKLLTDKRKIKNCKKTKAHTIVKPNLT